MSEPGVVLYRCPTPTNFLCPCGAVARRLKKLGVEYRTERVPYRRKDRPEIVELTRQNRVPVLVDGDEVVHDSKRIIAVPGAHSRRVRQAGGSVSLQLSQWKRLRPQSSSPTPPPASSRSCSRARRTTDQVLRVAVRGGGCSGFQYALALDKRKDDDHVFERPRRLRGRRQGEHAVRLRLRGRLRRGPPGRRLPGQQPERRRGLRLRLVVPGPGRGRRTSGNRLTTGNLDETLSAANAALSNYEWADARDGFQAVLAQDEVAEAAEGLSWTGWWLGDERITMGARERAYRAYRAEGDTLSAARMAIWLASDHLDFRGADTIATGWIERARRMLDGTDPCAEHGWLMLHEADIALRVKSADLATVVSLSLEAAELGKELGIPDLETVGLGQAGVALVAQGKVEEGMRRIDESTSLALAEEFELAVSPGWALCSAVSASEGVGDFPRAAQFCGSMRQMADRWGGRHFAGVCRSAYGNVLATTGGDWETAEEELVAAAGDLRAARPAMAGGSLARLGALRARQGRRTRRATSSAKPARTRWARSASASSPSPTGTPPTPRTSPSGCSATSPTTPSSHACPPTSCSPSPAMRRAIPPVPATPRSNWWTGRRRWAPHICSGGPARSPRGSTPRLESPRTRGAAARTRSTSSSVPRPLTRRRRPA